MTRYYGRKRPTADPRDMRLFRAHPDVASVPLPPKVDLRHKLPPCYDQGQLGSCGPNSGSGLMAFFYPRVPVFSRLQIYYDVRKMEGDIGSDGGVQTRDVLKTLANTGAAPEPEWPYLIAKFTEAPPTKAMEDAAKWKIKTYSSLPTESEMLHCLASGFPFLVGFEVFDSFEGDTIATTGVMTWPQKSEQNVGGHDVLAVGYDLNFKSNPAFKASGVDPALVANEALLIRNSWGLDWGWASGHFWMPLTYASDPNLGGDNWTWRLTSSTQTIYNGPIVDGVPIQGEFV